MSFKRLMLAITFLIVFAAALRISIDSDTWWHLRAGESIVRGHEIPKDDSYSFTRNGATWLYPSAAWLSQAQLYLVFIATGLGGLNAWTALLATLAFAFIYPTLGGGPILRAFAIAFAAFAAAVFWAARPYMWSFVFAAAFIWILEDWRWGRRDRLLWLPAVMLVWANSHPGFAVGLILLAIYGLDRGGRELLEQRRPPRKYATRAWREWGGKLALVAAGILLAICINPSGPIMLRYPFDTVSLTVLRDYIQEWQSADFHARNVLPFTFLATAVLAVLVLSRKPKALSDLLLIGVFGAMALLAGRNIALFALAAPIVLTRHAAPLLNDAAKKLKLKKSKPVKGNRVINAVLLIALLLAVAVKASQVLPDDANWSTVERSMPLGAVRYVNAHRPAGRIFNSYNWGGFLIWELQSYPVFTDGRTDLYGDQILAEWLSIANAEEGWQAKLENWNVRLVLLEPSWALSKVLPLSGWQMLYQDELSVLYTKP